MASKLGAKTKENLLREDEVRAILAAAEGDEIPILNTLAYTGFRVSELVHFKKEWIDGDMIKIPPEQPCNEHFECRARGNVWRVKVKSAARSIPILPELQPILTEFFASKRSFTSTAKGRENVWRMVRRVARRAGVKKRVFPHVFRGSLASVLAGKDLDALSIQGWFGWKSIKTADEYIRISPDRLRKIALEKWKHE